MSKKRKTRANPKPRGPKVKPARPYTPSKTENGRTIQKLLRAKKMDPRAFKDWVILTPGRMLEWMGSYDITSTEGKPLALGEDTLALIHKRELHGLVPDLIADRFWHRTLKRRVQRKGPGAPA